MERVHGIKKIDLLDGLMYHYVMKVIKDLNDVIKKNIGINEAKSAGQLLAENNFEFDMVFTSVLERSITTFNLVADVLKCHHIPIIKNWRLNERHYGALQGLNKVETALKHGEEQVKMWRRSYDLPPPALESDDTRFFPNYRLIYYFL